MVACCAAVPILEWDGTGLFECVPPLLEAPADFCPLGDGIGAGVAELSALAPLLTIERKSIKMKMQCKPCRMTTLVVRLIREIKTMRG